MSRNATSLLLQQDATTFLDLVKLFREHQSINSLQASCVLQTTLAQNDQVLSHLERLKSADTKKSVFQTNPISGHANTQTGGTALSTRPKQYPCSDRVTIHLTATQDVRAGRFSRVAVLGQAGSGQVQEAPKIGIVID